MLTSTASATTTPEIPETTSTEKQQPNNPDEDVERSPETPIDASALDLELAPATTTASATTTTSELVVEVDEADFEAEVDNVG